ncbi:ankyrin repeat-containing domain protein [Mycena vitilis]|nr:ankyrin repeat-containing domain protein [Mycena vitilis]
MRAPGITGARQHLSRICRSLTVSVYHCVEGKYAEQCRGLIEYATTDSHRDQLLSGYGRYKTQDYAVPFGHISIFIRHFTPNITALHFILIDCTATYAAWNTAESLLYCMTTEYPLSLTELHSTFAYTSPPPALLLDARRGTFFPPPAGRVGRERGLYRIPDPRLERVESTAAFSAEDVPEKVPAEVRARLVFTRLPRNLEVVKLLLDAGDDIDANNGEALRTASKKWDTQMVKLLIDAGADVNASNGEALRIASKGGNKEIVKLLIEGGANVEANDGGALSVASEEDIVRLLVEAGADTNANSGAALKAAARYRNGKTQIFKLLIEASADLARSVELLVGAGAHVANGALYAASKIGNAEVVRLLLEGGAPVDINGCKGYGSALYAASCNGDAEVIRLLVEGGSDIVANGRYALRGATDSGNAELVKLLTELGADIEAKSGRASGETTGEKAVVVSSRTFPSTS